MLFDSMYLETTQFVEFIVYGLASSPIVIFVDGNWFIRFHPKEYFWYNPAGKEGIDFKTKYIKMD